VTLLFAWLLAWAAGIAVYCAFDARRRAGWLASAAGHGLVFGMLLAAAMSDLFARDDTDHALRHAWLPLAILAVIAAAIAFWRRRTVISGAIAAPRMERWKIILLAAGFLSVVYRGYLAVREILLRPTFPWDAWDAWAVKSKTWFLLGHYAPFVSAMHWVDAAGTMDYTGPAWSYPSALAWVQIWFASAAGAWIEPLVNLPWIALWVGLLLAHYGQWRALGFSTSRAAAFAYALASLPLITVHVALAGYADLWIATLFGFAVLAWMRWLMQRDINQLALAVACVLVMPWMKLEGAVWMLLSIAVAIACQMPRRARHVVLGTLAIVGAIVATIGHIKVPLFGLGWVSIAWHSIEVPVIGTLSIAFHAKALGGAFGSLFLQPSWNLLWWLVPVVIVWRWREFLANRALRCLGALLTLSFGFLAFLFLFTDAAQWAESYTAINRLVMHLVPAVITLLAMLLRDVPLNREPIHTAQSSAPRSSPA
jgi:hypothetical protein